MKIPSRFLNIPRDLLAQRLHRRKLDLIAHPVEKTDLDFALRRQIKGMKVQQVSLNRKRIRPKRRTIAHIRDRIEALLPNPRTRDINAILRDKFFIARQIDGRNGVLRAQPTPAARSAQNAERT